MTTSVNRLGENDEVAALYVKNVSEKLMRRVRATCAERGETMREFVVRAVERELKRLGVEVPEDDR
jgi:uncharacterized protein involved in cysteine biosynthesis